MQGATSLSATCLLPINGWAFGNWKTSGLSAWVTTGQQKFQAFPISGWQVDAGSSAATIEIDPTRQFQSVLGFGGAFTDASCYLLGRMTPGARRQLMEDFFGADGLRLSIGRTCIGASDYSRSAYSFDDSPTPDPSLTKFSIAPDREYVLPTLRDALRINPEMFYISTPWSPPGWMKAGGSLLGGSMRSEYFSSYAQYFVRFIQAYKAEGIMVNAVTSQNEVDTDQNGRMPAALWGQEYEAGFISKFLGPAFRDASIDTKILILDHNYNLWGRAMDELNDPSVYQYVDGVAWHSYMGTPDAMTRVHDAFPDKHSYWTEGGPDFNAPDYATDWTKWAAEYARILKNWARCIVAWNLVLDEKGGPKIGPFDCGGVVTLNSKTHQLTRSGQYWAFAHYSKVVRRGARVIGSTGKISGVEHVAFANPQGNYVMVLSNTGQARDVRCRFKGKAIHMNLPSDSVVTLQWS
ncbi:MAG TPA: glycoside hydrolase family 30 beta sandwich domain-containing protein [Acidobacteriaceae bacterium]|nr:glycoside hydrolase family 30 beta sandwich domain-containing protein [Acidobacteriaceae bacterium]